MKKTMFSVLILFAAAVSFAAPKGESYFKKNDTWLLVGDSITQVGTYENATFRILNHFHPDSGIKKFNVAVWGAKADYVPPPLKADERPDVVTIMLGMNGVIHRQLAHKRELTFDQYRKWILDRVKGYQKLGSKVILLTPTLTDERTSSIFYPYYTSEELLAYRDVIRELGRTEGCIVIPVSEELEEYDDSLGPNEIARNDGVHPSGEAQYRIAYSLLHHLNVAGALTGTRAYSENPVPVPVKVTRAKNFLNTPDEKVVLHLKADKAVKFNMTWSLDGERGSQVIELADKGEMDWTLPASNKAYEIVPRYQKQAVVDLQTDDGKLSFYLIDLAKTRVVKPVNGELEFALKAPPKTDRYEGDSPAFLGERPEWKAKNDKNAEDVIATLKIKEFGKELWFSGDVFDSELVMPRSCWISSGDFVRLMLDFRPAERFGHLQPDRDVTMVFIAPRTEPEFSLMGLAWWGPQYQFCMYSNGKRNPDGFSWRVGFAGYFTNIVQFDIQKLDYYGFNLAYVDRDSNGSRLNSLFAAAFDTCVEHGLNQLIIVDRKNKFPGTETTTVQCWGF